MNSLKVKEVKVVQGISKKGYPYVRIDVYFDLGGRIWIKSFFPDTNEQFILGIERKE